MIEEADCGARLEPRTNIFVMATIAASTASGPVKVRNLSARGALIEGAVLPAPQERVRLCRGRLAVTGEVVWSSSGRAGLRFDSRVRVEDWLPTGANRAAQQRVDELLQQLRADAANCAPASGSETGSPEAISPTELRELARAIEILANDLAGDDAIVRRHFSNLQTLDITAQVLRKLSAARA